MPAYIDPLSWRRFTLDELIGFVQRTIENARTADLRDRKHPSVLSVRHYLSPVDVCCYLKARFGEPNGFQNFLRKDDSSNWIHWEFSIKAGETELHIAGTDREIHFIISESMTDENWRDLILNIRADYRRIANEKSDILKSLEKWVVLPNKFVEISRVCAGLHASAKKNLGNFLLYKSHSNQALDQTKSTLEMLSLRASRLYRACLQLSLLTPVLAEAFINMLVLILCKEEIRANKRQFDAFIRSQIDAKIFDLPYKCNGFVQGVDQNAAQYKNFKRVMDKRNNSIHGNADPEKEQLELVYFEAKRPLFKDPGDRIGKLFEAMERQYNPEGVVKDYEDVHEFLCFLVIP